VKVTRRFPHQPTAMTVARRFVAEALEALPASAAFDVELMVSELATNCIRHTASGFILTLEVEGDVVRVEMTDTGPGRPEVRFPLPSEPTGRGLHIVEGLSDEWGVSADPDRGGKTVWFVYRVADQSAPAFPPS
jgi:serine/threonine-protein kinase RsbW